MFVARSCTKWVYLIFAINRADLKQHLRNNPMKEVICETNPMKEMILQNSPYERSVLSNKKPPVKEAIILGLTHKSKKLMHYSPENSITISGFLSCSRI